MFEIHHYVTATGVDLFARWLEELADRQARVRIKTRIDRVSLGNFGDVEPVGEVVSELRIDWGPGYRVYFARVGKTILLLLCGGDKRTQRRDIENAKTYFEDYKRRTEKARPGKRATWAVADRAPEGPRGGGGLP
jgi:putative addiction module killer protein